MAYGTSSAGSKKVSAKQAGLVAARFGMKKEAPAAPKAPAAESAAEEAAEQD